MIARLTGRLGLAAMLAAGGLPRTRAASDLLPESTVLARAPTLPLQDRQYLVYLYARLHQPRLAEELAKAILAERPGDRSTLLALASMYSEANDAVGTAAVAQRMLAAFPNDAQGLYYLSVSHTLARNFDAAYQILRDLKATQFSARRFPYEADLGAAAQAAGHWRESARAYEAVLRDDTVAENFRDDVHQALSSIYREHMPRAEVTLSSTRFDRADVTRTNLSAGGHIHDHYRGELLYQRDAVTLEPAPGLRGSRHSRADFSANLARTNDHHWRASTTLGWYESGAFGSGRISFRLPAQRELSLELAARSRAIDSLALEALDGRQDQAVASFNWAPAPAILFGTRAYARKVRLDGMSLGHGSGIEFALDRSMTWRDARLMAGLRGSIATFSPNGGIEANVTSPIADPAGGEPTQRAILANLLNRRINRHGGVVTVSDDLAEGWVYRLTAGVDYDFELSTVGWNAALGLTFTLRRSLELTAEAAHTSNASGSNAGSSATTVNMFMRAYR